LVVDILRADPIFILGIMPRSGTNYLWDLLCLHPDCARARSPINEDFLLECSDHLVAYTREVRERWDPMWGVFSDDLGPRFRERLGDGLISYLWEDRERRLVTKTPSVRHIDRFFTFFPHARLIVLVRDGRSVAQSCMSTFGWDFDRAARNWATAAEELARFESDHRYPTARYLRVRYEDLVDDLKGSISRIFGFLELEEGTFDPEAADALPVRGSSSYFGPGRVAVNWDPVERGPDFDPRARWRSWTPQMHERFEWIAGKQMRSFGYQSVADPVRAARTVVRHTFLDWNWQTRAVIKSAAFHARVRLGTATRPLRERLGLVRSRP
jgi:protein-tyrosine sulfotransferase